MVLDLQTPVSQPPSQGTHPSTHAVYPPPKIWLQEYKIKKAESYISTVYDFLYKPISTVKLQNGFVQGNVQI